MATQLHNAHPPPQNAAHQSQIHPSIHSSLAMLNQAAPLQAKPQIQKKAPLQVSTEKKKKRAYCGINQSFYHYPNPIFYAKKCRTVCCVSGASCCSTCTRSRPAVASSILAGGTTFCAASVWSVSASRAWTMNMKTLAGCDITAGFCLEEC